MLAGLSVSGRRAHPPQRRLQAQYLPEPSRTGWSLGVWLGIALGALQESAANARLPLGHPQVDPYYTLTANLGTVVRPRHSPLPPASWQSSPSSALHLGDARLTCHTQQSRGEKRRHRCLGSRRKSLFICLLYFGPAFSGRSMFLLIVISDRRHYSPNQMKGEPSLSDQKLGFLGHFNYFE